MPSSDASGHFVWYDLVTPDPDPAIAFYKDVVGWGTQSWAGSDGPYTMWTVGDVPIGGVLPAADASAAAHWRAYVAVADVDEAVGRASGAGGSVLEGPHTIPGIGRSVVLSDPHGAALAAFEPEGAAPGHRGDPRVGDFSWHELATTDHRAAWDFYSAVFGWRQTDETDLGEMGVYRMFGAGDGNLGGMYDKGEGTPGGPAWLCYVRVYDLDAAVQRVGARGGRVVNGPLEVPGGDRIAQCSDPQRAAFALHQTP